MHEHSGSRPRGTRMGAAGGGGRGRGRGPWAEEPEPVSPEQLGGWLAGRLPTDWFTAAPKVSVDREEILVVGTLAPPQVEGDAAAVAAAEVGRITRFREETREHRMAIAREAGHRFGRSVAWGAVAGDTREVFTTLSVPVMTRLRQPERQVLDTLVGAGVARSRSDALVWCVRLVGQHTDQWLADLREAMTAVERVRSAGPQGSAGQFMSR